MWLIQLLQTNMMNVLSNKNMQKKFMLAYVGSISFERLSDKRSREFRDQ